MMERNVCESINEYEQTHLNNNTRECVLESMYIWECVPKTMMKATVIKYHNEMGHFSLDKKVANNLNNFSVQKPKKVRT